MTTTNASITSLLTCFGLGALSLLASESSVTLFGGIPVLVGLMLVILGIQWVAFVPAWLKHTEKFYDLVGTQTFVLAALLSLGVSLQNGSTQLHHYALVGAICAWGLRLGSFLVQRVHKVGKDGRFDEIKFSFPQYFMAWTVQALWIFATALPAWIILTSDRPSTVDVWVKLGLALWVVGFAIEVIADRQKSAFRARNPEGERWIDEGLWGMSQHPNYFGEILLWTGLFVSGIGFYQGMEWLAVVSPLFVVGLLTRGSGVPILQERAEKRWGHLPEFQSYRRETNLLIPLPSRRKSSQA